MRSLKDILESIGHVRLFEWFRRIWGLLIAIAVVIILIAVASFFERKDDVKAATAQIFETKIVVRGKGPARWHYFDYSLPESGSAILKLSNGARRNAPSADRVEGAEVTLRGKGVITPKEFNQKVDDLDVPIKLQAGTNRLGVRLQADAGKRVSLSIDAPADKFVLAPVPNAVVIGRESLRARATVTALGQPIQKAEVQFEVLKLGRIIERKATTSNAGIATAFLSGLDAGEGQLRAKLIGSNLSDAVPVTAVVQRNLTMNQLPESLRFEAGSARPLTLKIDLQYVANDKDIVKLEHIVKPNPSDPTGIKISTNFPPEGHLIEEPRRFSVVPTIMGITPGLYTIISTVTVTGTEAVKARESFSTELSVEVVKPGTTKPLVLNEPIITPSAIRPAAELTRVVFGTTIVSMSKRPQVLFLEKVTKTGKFISKEGQLGDDGKEPDAKPGDGFYSGVLQLGSEEETEIYFRLRAEYFGETVFSNIAVFPITRVRLDYRPSRPPLVERADGRGKLYANEVIVGSLTGVSSRRVRTIVADVGNTLGLESEDIRIEGYIPSIDAYLVEFKQEGRTLEDVNQAISAFKAFSEIKYASPHFKGQLTSQWFLEKIRVDDSDPGIDDLRERAGLAEDPATMTNPSRPPMYGWPSIGVAVMDNGVDCNNPDLSRLDGSSKCADTPSLPDGSGDTLNCTGVYVPNEPATHHGSKVAALVAGQGNNSNDIQGVEGGVAWNTQIFPFAVDNGTWALHTSIDCARHANNLSGEGQIIHILNISWIENYTPDEDLTTSLCNAVCDGNMLVVAAAGNNACVVEYDGYPAYYNDDGTLCSCGVARDRILDVGGSDVNGQKGWRPQGGPNAVCPDGDPFNCFCSATGEIYAPGWGVPDPSSNNPINYGTSWSAPLVSGCAAILGAVEKWKDEDWEWDPSKIEERIVNSFDETTAVNVLDCWAAVSDQYDIVFVLDRSGSMRLPIGTNPTRWGALTEAVNGFLPLIYATALPGNNFGLTLFASEVLSPAPSDPRFMLNDSDFTNLVGIDVGLSAKVASELNSQTANVWGRTAMGAGLQDGMAKITDATRPRVVVLFTDGEQNEFPKVDTGGCQYNNSPGSPVDINPGCGPGLNQPDWIKIITVGIVQPSSPYLSTLQALAHHNQGTAIITSDGAIFSGDGLAVGMETLQDAFALAIAPALADNSPQMVASYKGTLSHTVTLPAFDLNKKVSQLIIHMSFSRTLSPRELSLISESVRIMKDGLDITSYFQPIIPGNSSNSLLLKTNFVQRRENETSTIKQEGSYIVKIGEQAYLQEDLGYQVVPYADDHLLNLEWQVNPEIPRVNRAFAPTIRLSWRGKPVTNARIEARILRPGDDMNDLLAKHPQKVDPSSGPDAGSPGYQKYLHLLEKDPAFLAQLRPKEHRLSLAHQGDGEYSALYNPGDISGIYQILYRITAEDVEFGRIQRLMVQSIYTRFGDINFDGSAVTSTVNGRAVTINFRPVTNYGRFIGPAQGSAFSVDGTGIRLSNITDHQDGSYTLVLAGNPDARISIKLLDEVIYEGPASSVGKGFDLLVWLIWLIIILILLSLIWLIWRVI